MARLPSTGFWNGRRVLLTGHTGFKGAWAALWLRELGADVTGFALAPDRAPCLFELAEAGAGVKSIIGDLRDREAVKAAVAIAGPQIVLHMAAQPIVRQAIAEPLDTLATNVMGMAHLLDALRDCQSLQAVVVVTSDKVYANSEAGKPFVETDRLGGKDPYSASKAAAELVAASYSATYFAPRNVPLATARGGNVVGGGDYAADRIVPDIYRAVSRGERLALRMPEATRPWQHVLDCLCGYLLFAENLASGRDTPRALNFGPRTGADVTVAALAAAMLQVMGKTPDWDRQPVPGSVEMKALAVDSTLARETLGWRDLVTGADIVHWTAGWYRRVIEGHNARAVTLEQIAAYSALAGEGGAYVTAPTEAASETQNEKS